MEPQTNMRVTHPCPMSVNRMEQNGSDFFCRGCSKTVTDFRGKNPAEIKSFAAGKNCCGVFNSTQLNQPKFSLRHRFQFAALTFLAFFGMHVKPIYAQTQDTTSIKIPSPTESTEKKSARKTPFETKELLIERNLQLAERKKKQQAKTKNYKVVGCPSF